MRPSEIKAPRKRAPPIKPPAHREERHPNPRPKFTWLCVLLIAASPIYASLMWFVSVKQTHADDCPIVLDLNMNGEIDVTGLSTSERNVYSILFLPKFVEFDLRARGTKSKIDWLQPDTDGFLLDLTRGVPPREIDGSWLFANDVFPNGFVKLATFDRNRDQKLTGKELKSIALWLDNGDGLFEKSELRTLESYGIDMIPTVSVVEDGPFGGKKTANYAESVEYGVIYMEDVWFLGEDEVYPTERAFSFLRSLIL